MAGYVDPFGRSLVAGGRIDEGVDPTIRGPIRAVGDAVVETVTHFSGFGTYVAYRLTSGPLAGRRIFISEGIRPHVKTGQRVAAGQVIATGTGAIETGWAGGPRGAFLPVANRAQGGNYTEGKVTAAGRDFLAFMKSVGVNPGPGGKPGKATGVNARPAAAEAAANSGGGLNIDIPSPGDLVTGALNAFFGGFFDQLKTDASKILLTIGLIGLGAVLAFAGFNQLAGGAPMRAAKTAGKTAVKAAATKTA
jgi:hypothetical protein